MNEEEFIKKYKEKDLEDLKVFKKKAIIGILVFPVFYVIIIYMSGYMQVAHILGENMLTKFFVYEGILLSIILLIYSEKNEGIKRRWKDTPDNKNE